MRAFALVAFSIILVSSWAGPARASLFWEFGFNNTVNNFSGQGTIRFNGPDTSDGIAEFNFTGVCGHDHLDNPNNCSFGLTDVEINSWVINESWAFDELRIITSGIPTGNFAFQLLLGPADLTLNCQARLVGDCNGQEFAFVIAKFGDGAFLRPIHDAPEPPTLGLFSLALLALAAAGWLPRRRRNSGGSLSGV